MLVLWVAAIALFFNRWGKIRMLEPYQPKFQQHRQSCALVDISGTTQVRCAGVQAEDKDEPDSPPLSPPGPCPAPPGPPPGPGPAGQSAAGRQAKGPQSPQVRRRQGELVSPGLAP